ncbi:hypothetical protein V8G54_013186 [Vigna mungo]|uniref:(S)-ureidoglycine aminohydrolase cupin domain-containing protein n=1 Tax=Vigna mungo TaxID=3915 RepID=A0AAQ3NTM4_VIGMU
MNNVIEKLGLKIIRNAPEEMLTELGVRQWTIWSCPPRSFHWIYGSKETCYILEGKVKITVKDESVEIVAVDARVLVGELPVHVCVEKVEARGVGPSVSLEARR